MATTFVDYTGDGNATKAFSFPSYKVEDIKVDVDGVIKTVSTHYNITSYTTTGGGNVVFTSGNIPVSPAAIRIFRDTDVDSAKATYTAGSSVKAGDLNNNQTQLLYAAQEEQNQTILTSDIKDAAVTTAKIKADNITSALIADDQINSEHYVDGSIDTAHIADAQITTAKIADDAVTADKLANSINTEIAANTAKTTNQTHTGDVTGSVALTIANDAVTTAKIAADAITGAKIADDSINSEHYVNGSIDTQHVADNLVTTAKIVDANVTTAKIANNAVTTDKIADAELSTLASMQSGTASVLADSTALTATTAELNQLDGITLETSVTTNSDTRIPTSKAVNDLVLSVTNAIGGFVAIANETSFPTANPDPSNNAGTVVSISQLASGLAVNSSGVATISNGAGTGNTVTITGFPSSLVSQTLPATSGLQVQTTSTLHTYTFHKQLASAADIQAISATVNSFSNRYRVSASAPTSSLDGGDLWYDTTNSKLMVYSAGNSAWEESSAIGNFFISTLSSSSSTGGGSATANGTAYRFTISNAPTDAQQLLVSVDGVIQKPNAGSSQPSEGFVLVGNDIIFGAAPANGASIFVTVIGSTVGIGTPSDNTVTTAILQNASVTTAKIADSNVTTAKIADSNVTTAKIAADAITGAKIADDSINSEHYVDGSIDTAHLANNSVTSAKIVDATIVNADISNSAAITGNKLADDTIDAVKLNSNSVTTAKIADEAVTLAKLPHGTSSNNGKFLRANNGADPTFETLDLANLNATNLTSGTIPDARFPNALPAISGANLTNLPFTALQADVNNLTANIALLGFQVAANGSLAKYTLTDQAIDDFQDATGVDASASTNESRNTSGKYYSGAAPNYPTGGTVSTYTSGGNDYRVHLITSDGNFVASNSGTVDMLIVGGGGGGGNYLGGGGAGGEVLHVQSRPLTAATYAVQVGVGGAKGEATGSSPNWSNGLQGEGSYFGTDYASTNLYARPGGGGSGHGDGGNSSGGRNADGVSSTAITGTGNGGGGASTGSGGGTGYTPATRSVTAPSGQTWNLYGNYVGGAGQAGGNHVGGGGAGSFATGGGPVTGIGGNGKPIDITGTNLYWAGGGGGGSITLSYSSWGAGGLGGGGGGSSQNSPTGLGGGSALNAGGNAQQQGLGGTGGTNTGSGGGGGGHGDYDGGVGADGIVIIRYTTDQFLDINDLTLQSVDATASSAPTKADLVMLYEDGVGTATLNTDIKAFISRDSGTTFTQGTLVAEGDYASNKKIVAFHDLDISSQPSGTSICYKITTHNQGASKETRIHAVSHGWS